MGTGVGPLRYRVNGDKVAHQMIDGEVVILNLERGHYYSLIGTAAAIWNGVERGVTLAEVVHDLSTRYTDPESTIEPAARTFLGELVAEELVVADSGPASNGQAPYGDGGKPVATRPFETPTIEKYTDLEALLVLDPIHDVDETGWPTPWR